MRYYVYMLETVRGYVHNHHLVTAQDRVLVGVSGGADSVALLRILAALSSSIGFTVMAAHLNHGFRGEEAALDARFVGWLCEGLNIPVVIDYVDIPAIVRAKGGSPQQVARLERFSFFARVSSEHKLNKVALGHHRGDLAETMLLKLVRGAGLSGLTAMAPMEKGINDLTIVRPLLSVSREDIERYLSELSQAYREDSSNKKTEYKRNFVRHRVLPLLRELNPDAETALARASESVAIDAHFIDEQFSAVWPDSHVSLPLGTGLLINALTRLHRALAVRMVFRAYEVVRGSRLNLEAIHVDDCLLLLARQVGRRVDLPGGITALRTREHLLFYRGYNQPPRPFELELMVPGSLVMPDGSSLSIESVESAPAVWPPSSAAFAYVTCSKKKLKVRNRRPGDTYVPLGTSITKKLKEAMSEAMVPRPWRDVLPVVEADGAIMWVPGLRVSELFRADDAANLFKLTYRHGGT